MLRCHYPLPSYYNTVFHRVTGRRYARYKQLEFHAEFPQKCDLKHEKLGLRWLARANMSKLAGAGGATEELGNFPAINQTLIG